MASGVYRFSLNHHLFQKSICEDVLYLSPWQPVILNSTWFISLTWLNLWYITAMVRAVFLSI